MGKTFKDRKIGKSANHRQKFPRVRIPMDTGTIVHEAKRDKVRWQDEWEDEAGEVGYPEGDDYDSDFNDSDYTQAGA